MSDRKKFATAISEAALHENHNISDPSAEWSQEDDSLSAAFPPKGKRPQNEREAQAEAIAAFAQLASDLSEKYDLSVIWQSQGLVESGQQQSIISGASL